MDVGYETKKSLRSSKNKILNDIFRFDKIVLKITQLLGFTAPQTTASITHNNVHHNITRSYRDRVDFPQLLTTVPIDRQYGRHSMNQEELDEKTV